MENAYLLNGCFRCKYKGWVRSILHGFLKTTKQKIDLLQKIKNKKQLISNFKLFFVKRVPQPLLIERIKTVVRLLDFGLFGNFFGVYALCWLFFNFCIFGSCLCQR